MTHLKLDEREIFCEALDRPATQDRARYLDEVCGDDAGLRARVQALLNAHQEAGSFLADATGGTATHPDAPPVAEPGQAIGPYKLLERIGEGGMGEVWMAEQREPMQRKLALKIIKAGMDTQQVVARFEAERQALALMDHPNIAKVFDAGATDSGRPFFVMELVKGTPITSYCDNNRLTLRERLELFLPLCRAIQHAHQKGIIHRDIKPSNVLIAPYDGRPVPKIIDFGVAKATGQRLTERTLHTGFGSVVGTLEYMSPEQAELNNQDIDTRSDIYALGVLLYELLTGTTPLSHDRVTHAAFLEMLRTIREEEPPKPSTRLSDSKETLPSVAAQRQIEPARLPKLVRGELDWMVMKALEKDRTRRYETANGLAQDIEHYLHDEPVLACPPSPGYRVKKFLRRNKGPVTAAALVLLALLAGMAGTTWGLLRARQAQRAESRRAESERRAREEADAKAAETQAVLDFLENRILAAERPRDQDGGMGRDVSLSRAIETALPFLETSFKDHPLIEAHLRFTLGYSLALLGDARRSIEQHEVARRLYATHRGPGHPDTLRCMNLLSAGYQYIGQYDDALRICEETLALARANLPANHPETLMGMYRLASVYYSLGRYSEALKLRQEALPLQRAALGPDHPNTLRTLNDLANSYLSVDRNIALKLHEELLALQRAKLGPDHRDTMWSLFDLAQTYQSLDRYAEAMKFCDEALALRMAKHGPDHPDTLACRWLKGRILFDSGKQEEGLKYHEETLALQKAKTGRDHPYTLQSMCGLADNYLLAGRPTAALKLNEEALALSRAKPGREDPWALCSAEGAARSLVALHRDTEAVALVDDCLKRATGKVNQIALSAMAYLRLRHFEKAKDPAGCRATAELAEKLNPTDETCLYNLACMRAVTAAVIRANDKSETAARASAAEADRAMAWLKQAIAAGYGEVENLKTDKDLQAIRDRKDFQRLLSDLEASKQQQK